MHPQEKSYRTIYMTLIGDIFLFIFALIVSIAGHSKAVLSESVYQLSDVLSGTMLLFGVWSSLRPADELHPFGYGLERFFWSFVSAVFAFSVSGAAVMAYGINGILQPYVITDWQYSVLVLIVTMIVSALSLAYLMHRIRHHYANTTSIIDRYHQGVRTVLFQDVMSIVSSMVAIGGISLSVYEGNSRFDAIAAVANGVLLLITGLTLAAEGRELLIGKGLSKAQMSNITQAITKLPSVNLVRDIKTVYIGPESLMMLIRINFADNLTTDELEKAIDNVQHHLRSKVPELKNVIVEPES
ncbi:MAG: cation diffusion facilitator family transporter [Thermoplasmata archaeon]|nr:cation diffusion facilitator family transporter [Candidatus Sysuiplasma acidicola]MBX8647028.1 cation diffusion facilitator family transporter [Candidatus Sysuiplasma acidicola]MDH2905753.1 cation diffusion facilitator family transporter [Methanomassiliicoccales archaeon]